MIYQPEEDSYLLEEFVRKKVKGKTFLDMGSGSGIQSRTAMLSGAKSILAVDISTEAIKILKKQALPSVKSDLFKNVKGKFDIIAFNPPYLPEDKREDKESAITTTGGKRGDEIILRFLKQAPKHLSTKGTILLILSSLTPKDKILPLLKKLNLSHRLISKKKLFFETLELWQIRKTMHT